jgi:peptidoglycan/LPS O-acetylase OafA/YrhL
MGQTALLMLLRFLQQRIYPQELVTHYRLVHVLEPALLVPACVLWGYVLYRLVEKPANRWLRGPAAPFLRPRPEQAT